MIDERFSAYLDGEASPSEAEAVLSRLGRDPGLRATWGRQQWVRSVLRDADASAPYDPDFAERVDRLLNTAGPESAPTPVSVFRRHWRAAASLAAAASVVGAVLLVAEPLGQSGEGTAPVVADIDDEDAPAADNRKTTTVADAPRSADHWSVSDPAVEDQLNGYLLEHNGLARSYGMSGATPSFLRVATYGQGPNR